MKQPEGGKHQDGSSALSRRVKKLHEMEDIFKETTT